MILLLLVTMKSWLMMMLPTLSQPFGPDAAVVGGQFNFRLMTLMLLLQNAAEVDGDR